MALFTKDEESCKNCKFFWYGRTSGPQHAGSGTCCYLPEPQPRKQFDDWCGQWVLDKKPEEKP